MFCARLLDGLAGGNVSVANAYLADITAEEDWSRNFGKMSISSNLGFIMGPALAAVLGASALGETLPVVAAVGVPTFLSSFGFHNLRRFLARF